MAHVDVGPDAVHITLSLGDEILSLHGAFRIPYTHISRVSTDPPSQDWFKGLKFGTNIPGVKTAGTFLTSDGAIYYDYSNPQACLTFDLNHEHYVRAVVQVDEDQDHEALASAIASRISRRA